MFLLLRAPGGGHTAKRGNMGAGTIRKTFETLRSLILEHEGIHLKTTEKLTGHSGECALHIFSIVLNFFKAHFSSCYVSTCNRSFSWNIQRHSLLCMRAFRVMLFDLGRRTSTDAQLNKINRDPALVASETGHRSLMSVLGYGRPDKNKNACGMDERVRKARGKHEKKRLEIETSQAETKSNRTQRKCAVVNGTIVPPSPPKQKKAEIARSAFFSHSNFRSESRTGLPFVSNITSASGKGCEQH